METGKDSQVILNDVLPSTFCFLKEYLYGADVTLTIDNVCDVLYVSNKYLLCDLECKCYKYIETMLKIGLNLFNNKLDCLQIKVT